MTSREQKNIMDQGCNPCTGCGVCAIACPHDCISIQLNADGFYAPVINSDACLHCGICKTVCYKYLDDNSYIHRAVFKDKPVLAVVNNYFDQMETVSSAGVATRLAKVFYEKGYNVCGVVFDPKNEGCKHVVAVNPDDLDSFRTSKYLQSYTVEGFDSLDTEKKSVIFGTPCQIYGIRKDIERRGVQGKDILIDMFCSGVPSSLLWDAYKSYVQRQFALKNIFKVNFREKRYGWHASAMYIADSEGKEYCQSWYNDLFYYFFLKKVIHGDACYKCRFRHDAVYSDIRLGDFWGPKYRPFEEGVNLVVLLSKMGEQTWEEIAPMLRYEICKTEDIFKSQKIGEIPVPADREAIISSLRHGVCLEQIFVERKQIEVAKSK